MKKAWSILGLVGLLLSDAGAAESAARVVKLTVPWSQGSAAMADLRATARGLAGKTSGRVRLRFVEQHDLGDDDSAYDGGLLAGPYLARYSAAARVFALPLFFRTREDVAALREFMDAAVASDLLEAGLEPLVPLDLGFTYLHSRGEVYALEQLKSGRLWVPAGEPEIQRIFEAFEVTLEPLELVQVREALRAGTVDTVLAPPLGAILLQWHTEIAYVADTPCSYLGGVLVLRSGILDTLAPEDSELLRSELAKVFNAIAADLRQKEQEALEVLEQNGVIQQPLGRTSAQRDEWYAWAASAADRLAAEGILSADVLDQVRAKLVFSGP